MAAPYSSLKVRGGVPARIGRRVIIVRKGFLPIAVVRDILMNLNGSREELPEEKRSPFSRNAPRRLFEWLKKPSLIWLRVPLGVLLTLSGLVGFLPILGFWMIPLGLSLLAVDFPPARHLLNGLRRAGRYLWNRWLR